VQYHKAQDTFIADLEDGSSVRVAKGDVLPESHELVKRDAAGAGVLFRPLDDGSGDDGAGRPRSRRAAAPAGKGPAAPPAAQDKAK